MSYWHQMYPKRQRSERLEVPNGAARFEALMAKKLSDRDRSFYLNFIIPNPAPAFASVCIKF